jgi:hypothetical protein
MIAVSSVGVNQQSREYPQEPVEFCATQCGVVEESEFESIEHDAAAGVTPTATHWWPR